MNFKIILFFSVVFFSMSYKNEKNVQNKNTLNALKKGLKITPISHATAVITYKNETIYLDPTGGAKAFSNFEKPTYVLITDIHGDHLDLKTLGELDLTQTKIIVPKAVAEKLGTVSNKELIVINNEESKSFDNFSIEAIAMYNLREEALKFHTKGRGNGYVLTINKKRIYFSGDTEDIPEMRNLKNIDMAFICMNLPYTMTIESAAEAVLAFKPKEVYPFHYKGTQGFSNVKKFKEIVLKKNNSIKVIQWDWYPKN